METIYYAKRQRNCNREWINEEQVQENSSHWRIKLSWIISKDSIQSIVVIIILVCFCHRTWQWLSPKTIHSSTKKSMSMLIVRPIGWTMMLHLLFHQVLQIITKDLYYLHQPFKKKVILNQFANGLLQQDKQELAKNEKRKLSIAKIYSWKPLTIDHFQILLVTTRNAKKQSSLLGKGIVRVENTRKILSLFRGWPFRKR